MTSEERARILNALDFERRSVVYPGVVKIADAGVVRDVYDDGGACEIAYSCSSEAEVDAVIQRQAEAARNAGRDLEWKVYGHDCPPCLGERLIAAGFEAGDREQFMILPASEAAIGRLPLRPGDDIRRITNREGLRDVQRIVEEVGGEGCERQIAEFEFLLESHPSNVSVYVAYVDGECAAYGRAYFHKESQFAALYGGQTRERFRNRGLFSQIVAVRVHEALRRGVAYCCVDALPTSEPILSRRGFEIATYTQPYRLAI